MSKLTRSLRTNRSKNQKYQVKRKQQKTIRSKNQNLYANSINAINVVLGYLVKDVNSIIQNHVRSLCQMVMIEKRDASSVPNARTFILKCVEIHYTIGNVWTMNANLFISKVQRESINQLQIKLRNHDPQIL